MVHSNPTEKSFQFCHNVMLSCSFPRLVTTARVAVAGYVNLPALRLIEMSAIGLLVNISFDRCRYFLFKRCICKSLLKVINYARIAVNFSIRSLRCPPYCLHVATGDKRRMNTEERFMNIHTEVVCGSGHSRRVPRGCNCLGVCIETCDELVYLSIHSHSFFLFFFN